MRIAIVTDAWRPQVNGVVTTLSTTADTLSAAGHQVLVINPGSTQFNHTCMILTLPEMTVQTFALQGKDPVKSWNWGKFIHNE